MTSNALSPDAQAILLLCSMLGMPRGDLSDTMPLAQDEWNDLARRLTGSPGALLDLDEAALGRDIGLSEGLAARVARLLSRGGQLAVELERLASAGIWVITTADDSYPERLKQTLGSKAPNVLCGAGNMELLLHEGLAIVGSRDVDEAGAQFAVLAGNKCADSGLTVISGGAKGVDRFSMTGALEGGGTTVGVLADSLEAAIANRETRQLVMDGQVTLVTLAHPKAHFTVGNAMQRNKAIYGLARWALVVASARSTGGTWAGANANLKAGWVPLFVRTGAGVPEGNPALIRLGAAEFPEEDLPTIGSLRRWLESHTPPPQTVKVAPRPRAKKKTRAKATQAGLFDEHLAG